MTLGPLMIERKTSTTPPVLDEDPNMAQFRELCPNAFAAPEISLPHDPVAEAEREEERVKALWRKHCPAVFAAREELDRAQPAHVEVVRICREREQRVMAARNALSNAHADMVGERGDAESHLAIADGYAQVARHNVRLAQEALREAREKLAAATAAKP